LCDISEPEDLFGTPTVSPQSDKMIAAAVQWVQRILEKIDQA
jgi:hypothetical protein